MLISYPADEEGNHLFDEKEMDKYNIDPYNDIFEEDAYNKMFGHLVHPFTGVNYVDFFKELVEKEGCEIEFVFANRPSVILDYTKNVLVANVHNREKTKNELKKNGALKVYGTDDILRASVNGSGYNSKYGLLGSNKSTEERVKLFPEHGQELVEKIQSSITNTIPLWKNQMVLALGINNSKKALESQQAVSNLTNDMLKKNSETLKQGSIEIAEEAEKAIIDIETLKKTNQDLIETIDSVIKIHEEGHAKRMEAEAELENIEKELKSKLIEINVPKA